MKNNPKSQDLSIQNEYPKLVRDKIPEIIEANGDDVEFRALGEKEFLKYLKKKIIEEAKEVAETDTDEQLVEEMADIKEVLDALSSLKGFTAEQIHHVQSAKRVKRGGFEKRLLMLGNDKRA